MSHQDVVPVPKDTIDRWSYPPFEGRIEGDFVYGRGACDCKALLISQYEALQLLLKSGWQPRRTVLVAEGFDEETTGQRGAKKIMEYLESVYGRDSMLAVIDEGTGSERLFGHAFALPATAEKGRSGWLVDRFLTDDMRHRLSGRLDHRWSTRRSQLGAAKVDRHRHPSQNDHGH